MNNRIKEVALRVAASQTFDLNTPQGIGEFASRLIAELQKDAEPVAEVRQRYVTDGHDSMYVNEVVLFDKSLTAGTKLFAHPQPKAATVPEGWQFVPVEPIEAMTAAMEAQWDRGSQIDMAKREYKAALSAASSLPAQSEGEQK